MTMRPASLKVVIVLSRVAGHSTGWVVREKAGQAEVAICHITVLLVSRGLFRHSWTRSCEKHVIYFGDNTELNKLEVEKSSLWEKVGEGVVNKGNVIPEGILFGPYTGKFISAAEYEVIKAAKMESGNAWEIREVKKVTKNSGHLPLCQQLRCVSHFDPNCLHIYLYFLWFTV